MDPYIWINVFMSPLIILGVIIIAMINILFLSINESILNSDEEYEKVYDYIKKNIKDIKLKMFSYIKLEVQKYKQNIKKYIK